MKRLENEAMEGFLGTSRKKADGPALEESRLAYYKNLLKNKSMITEMEFNRAEKSEGLYAKDEDITVFLPASEMFIRRSDGKEYYVDSTNLNRKYNVLVKKVDEGKKLVTVSFNDAKALARPKIVEQIDDMLASGEKPVVPAIVRALPVYPEQDRCIAAFLDIYGVGIGGKLHFDSWLDTDVTDLRDFLSHGDTVEVAILKRAGSLEEGTPIYKCSHRMLATKISDLEKDGMKKDSGIIVRAINCPTDKDYFLATLEGYDDVTVSCYYPDDYQIVPGKRYRAYVSHIDSEKRRLRGKLVSKTEQKKFLGEGEI